MRVDRRLALCRYGIPDGIVSANVPVCWCRTRTGIHVNSAVICLIIQLHVTNVICAALERLGVEMAADICVILKVFTPCFSL